MNSLTVSVIVPTFNRANYLGECLDSLLAQSMPAHEIIVVDDGSEDGTPALLSNYGERIRHVRKENGGKPSAVNLGISMALGNLIWIFDDDDVALLDAIETRLACIQANPEVGFVFSPHYYGIDGPDGHIQRGRLQDVPNHGSALFLELMKGCFFSLASALVRAEVYRELGGFDIELLRSQDYDFALRLARTCRHAFSPVPSFICRQHSGLRGPKTIRSTAMERDKVFLVFDQRIGKKLRSTLRLGEYLVPKVEGVLPFQKHKHALINRMTVMASKGCIQEMFEDLDEIISAIGPNVAMNAYEQEMISLAICTGYAFEACKTQWPEFNDSLRRFQDSSNGKLVIRALAKGIYRSAKGYPGSISEKFAKLKSAAEIYGMTI